MSTSHLVSTKKVNRKKKEIEVTDIVAMPRTKVQD